MFLSHPFYKRKRRMPWRRHLYPTTYGSHLNKILFSILILEAAYGTAQICQIPHSLFQTRNTTKYSASERLPAALEAGKKEGEEGYGFTFYGIQVDLKRWEINVFKTRQDKEIITP